MYLKSFLLSSNKYFKYSFYIIYEFCRLSLNVQVLCIFYEYVSYVRGHNTSNNSQNLHIYTTIYLKAKAHALFVVFTLNDITILYS